MILPFANHISFLRIVTNIPSTVARTQHKVKNLGKILHTDFSKERGGAWAALGFMA